MLSRVEGIAAEEVEIGMPVAFATTDGAEGPLAVFYPAEDAS
jgi:hypothetical protein